MKLSNNILLASCLSVVFLAAAAGCIVEDRNLDEKGVFRCKEDTDCLEGSVCVKAVQDKDAEGTCTLEKEVDHCHDYDKDGYYAADEGYEEQCGFRTNNPQDLDDSNPNINPGADEVCDGVDNNQDGCVDGTCAVDGACTGTDKSQCLRLFRACAGVPTLEETLEWTGKADDGNTLLIVCNPAQFGGNFCMSSKDANGKPVGEWKFGYYNKDGRADYASGGDVAFIEEQTTCQDPKNIKYDFSATYQTASGSQTAAYTEIEASQNESVANPLAGNYVDEDCDGEDEKVESCDKNANVGKNCYASDDAKGYTVPSGVLITYNLRIAQCRDALEKANPETTYTDEEVKARCGCVGTMACIDGEGNTPVCVNGSQRITKAVVDANKNNTSGDMIWNCLGD